MTDKPQRSASASDDEDFRLAVGKIEQYKLLEGLYKKVCEENRNLEEKLSALQQSRNKDLTGAPSKTESSFRRSLSITQQILDAATAQQLEHSTELYQVMEKEKNQEVEILRKKCGDAQKELKKVEHESDELHGQMEQLMTAMTEKEGCMKELELRIEEWPMDDERRNRREKENISRELAEKGSGSSWMVVSRGKNPLENLGVQDQTSLGAVELRRKTDELQRRITELLNHNEKWNALCQELQAELDRVRGQLLEYQKAEGSVKDNLKEDLKLETKRRKDAEEMSWKARKQVEELEAKIFELERQLEDKERQERQMSMVAEELREKALMYEQQIQSYKEDFENEQRDHNITRSQLDSQRNQWMTIYKALEAKTQQLSAMMQRKEELEHNNKELQNLLDHAHQDVQLIKDHQKQQQRQQPQQQHTRTPSTEGIFWECQRCTYRNQQAASVCEMCAASRHDSLLSESLASRGLPSTRRDIHDTRPFRTSPGIGELEEDGIACY